MGLRTLFRNKLPKKTDSIALDGHLLIIEQINLDSSIGFYFYFLMSAKTMLKIRLLLIAALLLTLSYSLTVTSVTLQNPATINRLEGSLLGGTKLYFQGLGFSTTMDENIVFVGEYPCVLEDGATATSIVCRTSPLPAMVQT